jgi:ParB family chromosome partitioning protein
MATKKKAAKAAPKKGTKKRRGVKIEPADLGPLDVLLTERSPDVEALCAAIAADGGAVLATYREPLGGQPLVLAALPTDKVSPTPFQRDVSDAHVRKLTRAMDKTKRFLDPIIAVQRSAMGKSEVTEDESELGPYLTPNGNHRLTALKELGARTVIALVVPEAKVAYQILALNIEKAHNLRERALEVMRMYRDLAGFVKDHEQHYELEMEEPALVTLGFAYETRGRLAGGAYHPALRKVEGWIDAPLAKSIEERTRRAALVIELDDAVNEAVGKLKARGLTSPYLKSFVVARVNPLRFIKGDPPSFDELMATMTKRARGMKVDKIQSSDLAKSGGAPDED